jgi:SOS response associated peptidase (SRAP)
MCGRFHASRSAAEVARWFKTSGPLPNLRERYNAAPTPQLGVVLRDKESGDRRLDALRWGLIPFWANDAKVTYSPINAMAETVATKPAFRDAFQSRRCLVPADGFYQWKKLDATEKQPYRFAILRTLYQGLPRRAKSNHPRRGAHRASPQDRQARHGGRVVHWRPARQVRGMTKATNNRVIVARPMRLKLIRVN